MRRPTRTAVATGRRGRLAALVTVSGLGLLPAAGCASADDDLTAYQSDYANHRPLAVAGYPSAGSLEAVQKLLWRLADGNTAALAELASSDGTDAEHRATAGHWIDAYRPAAGQEVTADFHDDPTARQTVVLYFHATRQRKQISLRLDGRAGADGWRVLMRESDPAEATAEPTWAPETPGGGRPTGGPAF
ncbi:hypothetical protein ACFQ6N_30045 [Kitasatospora sp. NPDC056446]|uniref:hypothetical protein n=1 Tax=Kitasatospora sp. NPDC056446 TaxID=3345819 RepID=UPI0036AC6EC7